MADEKNKNKKKKGDSDLGFLPKNPSNFKIRIKPPYKENDVSIDSKQTVEDKDNKRGTISNLEYMGGIGQRDTKAYRDAQKLREVEPFKFSENSIWGYHPNFHYKRTADGKWYARDKNDLYQSDAWKDISGNKDFVLDLSKFYFENLGYIPDEISRDNYSNEQDFYDAAFNHGMEKRLGWDKQRKEEDKEHNKNTSDKGKNKTIYNDKVITNHDKNYDYKYKDGKWFAKRKESTGGWIDISENEQAVKKLNHFVNTSTYLEQSDKKGKEEVKEKGSTETTTSTTGGNKEVSPKTSTAKVAVTPKEEADFFTMDGVKYAKISKGTAGYEGGYSLPKNSSYIGEYPGYVTLKELRADPELVKRLPSMITSEQADKKRKEVKEKVVTEDKEPKKEEPVSEEETKTPLVYTMTKGDRLKEIKKLNVQSQEEMNRAKSVAKKVMHILSTKQSGGILKQNNMRYLQEGGMMPSPDQGQMEEPQMGAAAGGAESAIPQALEMAAQALQSQDGQMALQACQMLLDAVGQMQGGGAEQGPPAFKRGGKIKKAVSDKQPKQSDEKVYMKGGRMYKEKK